MAKIIGRKTEQQQLNRLLEAKEAEFLVVYGRRRVGKTFLIRNYFKDQFSFYHTALSPLELDEKDSSCTVEILSCGKKRAKSPIST